MIRYIIIIKQACTEPELQFGLRTERFGFGFGLRVQVRVRTSEFGFGLQSSGSGTTKRIRSHRVFTQLFTHFLKYIDDHGRNLGSVRFGIEFGFGFFRTSLIPSVQLNFTPFYCLTENDYIQDRTRTRTVKTEPELEL